MLGSLILTAALMGQAKPAAKPVPMASKAQAAKLIEKRRARSAARHTARVNRESREAIAEADAIAKAKKEYKEMLPYMLEHQKQVLQYDADMSRNAALNRMAGAMERKAGYIYPGQSPALGPYNFR